MKKLIAIFLSALLLLSITVFTGCEKSGDSEYGEIGISIISPTPTDSITVGDSIIVTAKLVGFTFEYSAVNYYFGNSSTPAAVFNENKIRQLAAIQEKDAQFDFKVSTVGLEADSTVLVVEAVSQDLRVVSTSVPVRLVMPGIDDTTLDFSVLAPVQNAQFRIGDRINIQIEFLGNLTLFDSLDAVLDNQEDPFYGSVTADTLKAFDLATTDLSSGDHTVKFTMIMKNADVKIRYLTFKLIEYIPTFDKFGEVGYALKSVIQTNDKGYITASSDPVRGTRVVKYDEEGTELWHTDIAATVGVAESICEDTDYQSGYVLAGWRISSTGDKDTWVRKINNTDGGLIWNKQFGYPNCEDGATVIKKAKDDGYLIGGFTKDRYVALYGDSLIFSWQVDSPSGPITNWVRTTWKTGYDVRILKLYSNGNEVWGHNALSEDHKMWNDISLHKYKELLWVRKMGDQYVTDLTTKDDDNGFYITGWNNNRLYFEDGTEKKDMFFAELDVAGRYISTMTWSRMSGFDITNVAGDADPYAGILNVVALLQANALGDYTEDEIGYSIIESLGGYEGAVVMAGSNYQIDDNPTKSKLNDAWVVEFDLNADDDGALWEYTYGEASKNEIASCISKTKDGGYVFTGYSTGADMNTYIFKLGIDHTVIWNKSLGITGSDSGVKVIQASDGGYLVGGNAGTAPNTRARLIKVNKTGDLSK